MAKWVRQSVISSASTSAEQRLRYLDNLLPRVDAAIQTYFEANPDGEAVTLYVLEALGRAALEEASGSRTLSTMKQDVGRLVAVRLCTLYGAENVETYRQDEGTGTSSRPAPKATQDWISSFTPHRLRRGPGAIRIVLDTNVVRNALHKPEPIEFLERLYESRRDHPVSLADPAWAELTRSFFEHPDQLAAWRHVSTVLDRLLDPEFPVVPSGREAAVLGGVIEEPGFTRQEASRFYRLLWRFTAEVRRPEDFGRAARLVDQHGRGVEIGPLDPLHMKRIFDERFAAFRRFTERSLAAEDMSFEDAREMVRDRLRADMREGSVARLDLYVRAVAQYGIDLRRAKHAHVATDNDAIDLDILFCSVLPAWICTNEGPMRSLVQRSGSPEAERVMTPAELLAKLKDEPR